MTRRGTGIPPGNHAADVGKTGPSGNRHGARRRRLDHPGSRRDEPRRFSDLKTLADKIKAPPRAWTPERLWRAYETLDKDRVRGASAQRLLTDLVSLVRFAMDRDEELTPFGEHVRARFDHWLVQQHTAGRDFTTEQVRWLEMIRDHIAASVEMTVDDLDYAPFAEEGGLGRAKRIFGDGLGSLLDELNGVLAA